MNLKNITAPTIHAALQEARRQFGEDVVLLESVPPRDGAPARITVLADAPLAPVSAPARETASVQEAPAAPSPLTFGYGARRDRRAPAALAEEPAAASASLSAAAVASGDGAAVRRGVIPPDEAEQLELSPAGRRLFEQLGAAAERARPPKAPATPPAAPPVRRGGRGELFPTQEETVAGAPLGGLETTAGKLEELLQAQLRLLHERLDLMERRFGGAFIGSAQRWMAHPLFSALLENGMRPATLTRLFDALAQKGYEPETKTETLRWAFAQEMRRHFDLAAPKQSSGALVFIGPSGAGKTSLLLKLATHPGFFGRRRTAVIVIHPDEAPSIQPEHTVELYRRHGIAVQSVRTLAEMREAVLRVQHFDQLLIDTPPLPMQDAAARRLLVHVKRLVGPITPLQVQFVVNATRSLDELDRELIERLPLRPDVLALTHLDETRRLGRVAEWLMALEMPVQFTSSGAHVPDGIGAFSPSGFLEEMLDVAGV